MAYTEQVQQDLIGLMVGMFDAAPGQVIFNDVADAYRAGADYTAIANTLAGTDEFKSIYGSNLTDGQYVTRLVNNMLDGHVSDADQVQDVIDLFVGELNAGATRGQIALAAAAALRDVDPSDPVFGQAGVAFSNKVDVATYYSIDAAQNGNDLAELQAVLAGVDHTDASVEAAKDAIDGNGSDGGTGGAFYLTADQDIINGGAGDDLFVADVVQVGGLQVNSLGTGDRLNGGAGNDTLEAQVTQGATHGGSSMPVAPRTTSIENVTFEAINANQGGDNTNVYVDAGNMTGLQNIGSSHSVGNLVIQNLTTRNDNGNLRLPSDLTITMSHTGTNDSAWDESDLHVFFAQNNLLTDVESDTTASQANYWLADQDSTNFEAEPLQHIDRDGILFTLNGQTHGIRPADEALLEANTWQEFAQGLRDELAAMVAAGNTDLAGIEIIVDETNVKQTYTDSGALVTVHAITLVDSNGGEFSDLGFTIPENITGEFNVYGRVDTLAPVTSTSEIIATNIELEKVGRGGDGGELVVGGMEKGNGDNNYRDVDGVQQFNVSVVGGEELPNSLSALRSTNNQLQIVNIESDADGSNGYASLQIGNSNTAFGEYGLKDVRVLNAADFDGDLSVSAEITTQSFAKYVDLFDAVGDAAEDNVYFDYSLTGEGDNTVWLDVDMDLAAHEDFVLSVLTDGGDDTVVVRLDANGATQNQYDNQSALDNVTIGTGAGNDVIWTPGNGDLSINAGAGDDTVYSDNTGSQTIVNAHAGSLTPNGSELNAHWVANADNTNIHDLLGNGTGGEYFLYGSTLTVTLSGASVNGAGGVTTGVAGARNNGFEAVAEIATGNGYVANHTHVNQAIKDAINNDAVLSKLLVAKDGPNNSLLIESLIDGEFEATDLQITVNGPSAAQIGALTGGQQQQLNNAFGEFMNDSSASLGSSAAAIAASLNGQLTNLGNNYVGINGSQLATDGDLVVSADEVQTIDFTGFGVPTGGAGDIDVGGVLVALADGDTGAQIAAKVQAAINGATLANAASAVTATVTGSVVEITYASADGDVAPVVVAGGTATIETNLVPAAEQQLIDFSGASAAAVGNFGVGGILVNVLDTDTPAQLAAKTVAAINAIGQMSAPLGTVTATLDPSGEAVVVTFEVADGDVAAITIDPSSSGLAGEVVTDDHVAYDPIGSGSAGDIADAPVATIVDGQVGSGTGVVIAGEDSTTQSDNVINLGTGQDVVVLSTSDAANETLVWTGHNNGHNTIVNFTEDGAGIDQIDFSEYLTTQTSASGSAASAQEVAVSVQHGAGVVNANEVIVTSFASLGTATGVTWNNLSASSLEAALNQNNATWNRGTTSDQYSANKAVFMIEGGNDGQYKIFEVEFSNAASNLNSGFTVVDLVGVADFGDSINGVTDANFA